MRSVTVGLSLLVLPVAILFDSARRLGRKKWGWAVGLLVVELAGVAQQGSGGDITYKLTVVATLLVVLFGIYRLATAKKAVPR